MSAVSRSTGASPTSKHGSKSASDRGNSRQTSGRVVFPGKPSSAKSSLSGALVPVTKNAPQNPFSMPPDNDIFMLRDKERQLKKENRTNQQKLKVHEKTTYTSRINAKTADMRRVVEVSDDDEDEEEKKDTDGVVAVKDDPQFAIAITRDRHVEKENLADFISKKREMFLVQYSLGVKRDEMRKLEEIAQAEEKKLELAERYLEEDAAMFDEFLKENDRKSVDAIKIAEQEAKLKLEKVAEIKKINAQMMSIKSEISKNEETMKDYMMYKDFLDSLTPQDYRDQKTKEREEKRKTKEKERHDRSGSVVSRKAGSSSSERSLKIRKEGRQSVSHGKSGPARKSSRVIDADSTSVTSLSQLSETDEEESDEELELYFHDPVQLLDIFAELEEQNLSLIQNSQETEEALEELKNTIKDTQNKMNRETEALKQQIELMKQAIEREAEKADELEMKSKMFSYGEFKAEDQEEMLAALNKKVEEVYRNCIGDNEANISTLQMLTNIENRLEELFEMIEMMPPEKVEAAEKAKEKERRLRLREEKLEQQKLHQEDRVRRALARAQADPKKKTGKRLVFRSEPPQIKKKQDEASHKMDKEEEELAYFFS